MEEEKKALDDAEDSDGQGSESEEVEQKKLQKGDERITQKLSPLD